jgi:cell division septum initiation protein DivIVA
MPFNSKLFGYDRRQVDAAIDKLTFDAAEAAQHAERLAAELDRQRLANEELRRDHDQLSRALVSAHKAAQDIQSLAEQNAQTILADARERADALVRDAEVAVKVIEGEIDTLLRRRRDAEQSYAAFVDSVVKAFENTRVVGSKPSLTAIP